ncbi:MAG TPA: AIPR family protein [Terriglobales bacterium]|nr:AIPR family protein [Terriglobales bacterium]
MSLTFAEDFPGMTTQANTTLKTIVEAQRQHDYPELPTDKYFEIFSSQQVLKKLRFNPDPDEIAGGLLGGDGDAGVDGFYVYCNKKLIRDEGDVQFFKGQKAEIEIVVVQAKNKPSFEEAVPMKFKDFVENALGPDCPTSSATTLYSQELLDHVARFRLLYKLVLPLKPTLSATFFHAAHSDVVDTKVEERGRILCQCFRQVFPTANASYMPITGTDLVKLSQKSIPRTLPLKTPKYFDYTSFDRGAYACVVNLKDFYDFISDEGEIRDHLFEANVRDYAPDATVNQGIEQTLANPEGDDFWWLNNGITILAADAYYASGNLQVTDPLIVNGLQTSHVVFRHFKGGADPNDSRSMMVKVIVNSNEATSDKIIRATNSQTKISSIFLHATEQVHRDIELHLKAAGYFYDRRKNYYRNQGKSVSEIVTIHYLAQAVASIVLQQPDDARVRPGTVAEKNYKKLFSDKYPPALYTKCVQIMRRCHTYLRGKGLGKTDVLNLVFYLAMYVTCAACNSVSPKRNKIASLDVDAISDKIFDQCYKWIDAEFKALGGDDRVAKGPNLTTSLNQKVISQFGGAKGKHGKGK